MSKVFWPCAHSIFASELIYEFKKIVWIVKFEKNDTSYLIFLEHAKNHEGVPQYMDGYEGEGPRGAMPPPKLPIRGAKSGFAPQ